MYLIAELSNQFWGDIATAEQMILQAKMGGAHAAKIQLFDADALFGVSDRRYLSMTFEETRRLCDYSHRVGIEFFASFFDDERLRWCLDLDLPVLKIASILVEKEPELCQRAIATGRRTLVSLGRWDWRAKGLPFRGANVEYLYCVANYPATLDQIDLPEFGTSGIVGFSDHTIGTAASLYALARGAQVLEKHFTLSHSHQNATEQGHAGGMSFEELRAIRSFADAVEIIERRRASRRIASAGAAG